MQDDFLTELAKDPKNMMPAAGSAPAGAPPAAPAAAAPAAHAADDDFLTQLANDPKNMMPAAGAAPAGAAPAAPAAPAPAAPAADDDFLTQLANDPKNIMPASSATPAGAAPAAPAAPAPAAPAAPAPAAPAPAPQMADDAIDLFDPALESSSPDVGLDWFNPAPAPPSQDRTAVADWQDPSHLSPVGDNGQDWFDQPPGIPTNAAGDYVGGLGAALFARLDGAAVPDEPPPGDEEVFPDEMRLPDHLLEPTPATPAAPAAAPPTAGTEGSNPTAKFTTTMGTFTAEIFLDQLPITASNFIDLASTGFYNDLWFHRVIPDFMVQFGCPCTKSQPTRAGTGGPDVFSKFKNLKTGEEITRNGEPMGSGYIPDEFTAEISNERGTLAMGNAGKPNSGGSQFFVNVVDNKKLDWFDSSTPAKHPVFGKIIEGMDVVDAMSKVKIEWQDQPETKIFMKSIEITM